MDVAQGTAFGRDVAQVHRLVNDLNLPTWERGEGGERKGGGGEEHDMAAPDLDWRERSSSHPRRINEVNETVMRDGRSLMPVCRSLSDHISMHETASPQRGEGEANLKCFK